MNVVVCTKQVLDTEAKIKIKQGGKEIDSAGEKFIVNPYDEFAIEEALRLKEKYDDGSVVLVSLGGEKTEEALRTGLAMGADRAVLVKDAALVGSDSYVTAKVLAAAIKGLEYDLILCGKQAVDDDCAQVGAALAEFLDLPHVDVVTKLEVGLDKKAALVHRQVEGGTLIIESSLPAVITAQKGLNEPRYPSLPGIMKAKKKEIKVMDIAALGLSPDEVGETGARVKIEEVFLPKPRQAGAVIEGEPAETVEKLVKFLRQEAKLF